MCFQGILMLGFGVHQSRTRRRDQVKRAAESNSTTFSGIEHYVVHISSLLSRISTSAYPLWLTLGARSCPTRLRPYRPAKESLPRLSNETVEQDQHFPVILWVISMLSLCSRNAPSHATIL